MSGPFAPTKPKCSTCGKLSNVQAAPRAGTLPGTDYSQRWICGDCLYREANPDAASIDKPAKPTVPQEESLL